MKRTELPRRTPIKRSKGVRAKRQTPRRRTAPRWSWEEWQKANLILSVRAGLRCEICNKAPWTERHHRKRRRDGGDRLCNLLALCQPCHQFVTEHPANARKFGWIVSVNCEPDEIPVLWHRQTWMLLDDEGGRTEMFLPPDSHAHDV